MQRAQRRAMGPTKVRRSAKKSKFRKGGGQQDNEAETATAAALEEKGKEILKNEGADTPATPATAADVAAAVQTSSAPAPEATPQASE